MIGESPTEEWVLFKVGKRIRFNLVQGKYVCVQETSPEYENATHEMSDAEVRIDKDRIGDLKTNPNNWRNNRIYKL